MDIKSTSFGKFSPKLCMGLICPESYIGFKLDYGYFSFLLKISKEKFRNDDLMQL